VLTSEEPLFLRCSEIVIERLMDTSSIAQHRDFLVSVSPLRNENDCGDSN
jgi:hypothetical protein